MANIGTILTESDLETLLNDTIVKACRFWENVGLELGLPMYLINNIGRDHVGTENCKREMLHKWLINIENPTLQELQKAIQRVNDRHERIKDRDRRADDERKAIESISVIERLLDDWKQRNLKIVSDQEKLEVNLKKEEDWFQIVKSWNDEKAEWQQGEIAKRREKLREVLHHGLNFNNSFVEEFLREKGYQRSKVEDIEVEALLRQELMEIDIARSTTITVRFQAIKIHHKQLKHLQAEILEYRKLLEERLRAYVRIKEGMDNIGAKTEKLRELNQQLERMQKTSEKYIKTIDECDRIYREEQNNLDDWRLDLSVLIGSFDDNIREMTQKQTEIEYSLKLLVFALVGATVGTLALPIIGTIIGTAVGVAAARAPVVVPTRQVRQYRDTLARGKIRMEKLTIILDD